MRSTQLESRCVIHVPQGSVNARIHTFTQSSKQIYLYNKRCFSREASPPQPLAMEPVDVSRTFVDAPVCTLCVHGLTRIIVPDPSSITVSEELVKAYANRPLLATLPSFHREFRSRRVTCSTHSRIQKEVCQLRNDSCLVINTGCFVRKENPFTDSRRRAVRHVLRVCDGNRYETVRYPSLICFHAELVCEHAGIIRTCSQVLCKGLSAAVEQVHSNFQDTRSSFEEVYNQLISQQEENAQARRT
jgi:hypothetical protein